MEIYQILAAVLHLSNVEVKDQSADKCSILVNIDYLYMKSLNTYIFNSLVF